LVIPIYTSSLLVTLSSNHVHLLVCKHAIVRLLTAYHEALLFNLSTQVNAIWYFSVKAEPQSSLLARIKVLETRLEEQATELQRVRTFTSNFWLQLTG
jgi:hypothetical protein